MILNWTLTHFRKGESATLADFPDGTFWDDEMKTFQFVGELEQIFLQGFDFQTLRWFTKNEDLILFISKDGFRQK